MAISGSGDVLFLLFMIFLFVIVALNYYVVNELSYRYEALYKELGSPTRFFLNPGQLVFAYSFILAGRYKESINESHLRSCCSVLRAALLVIHIIAIFGIFQLG